VNNGGGLLEMSELLVVFAEVPQSRRHRIIRGSVGHAEIFRFAARACAVLCGGGQKPGEGGGGGRCLNRKNSRLHGSEPSMRNRTGRPNAIA